MGNHLAQHRELSLTAIGLATHILSVPEGTPVDIRSLAERFPEGRDRIAAALRELEAHGYLARVREHTESGRLITRTYVHHAPAAASGAASPAPLRVAGRPATTRSRDRRPVAGTDVQAAPEEGDRALHPQPPEPVPALVRPPAPDTPADCTEPPAPTAASTTSTQRGRRDQRNDRAVALLAGLRRADNRLILSRHDVDRLAPAVAAWFDGGATAAVIHRALTEGLPAVLRNPAKLIAYRLDELLPVPLPARPTPSPNVTPGSGPARRSDPLQNCDGCERAFRSPRPGRCRDCRADRWVPGEDECAA
ncbi:helix-turn-helix domain-containing protein [Streptomyces sp. RB17]|uniref:helix-turn-helix domain-containing protein n=1 Tax=Streptomyces sp. RB17 TaxID=2585197 RepID=UPI002B20E4D6|nr:helix-turn-helix domain-containing protein [Streptomyces sp. RB17]